MSLSAQTRRDLGFEPPQLQVTKERGAFIRRGEKINVTPDFSRVFEHLEDLMPSLEGASDQVKAKIVDRLTHPSRNEKDIQAQRERAATFSFMAPVIKEKLLDLMSEYVDATYGRKWRPIVPNIVPAFYNELFYLRNKHYPHWIHYHKKTVHREPYPDTSVVILRLAHIVSILQEIEALLMKRPEKEFKVMAAKISKTLAHPEVQLIASRTTLVEVARRGKANPFLAVREMKDMPYSQYDEDLSRTIGEAFALRTRLTEEKKLETFWTQFYELAGEGRGETRKVGLLEDIWKLDDGDEVEEEYRQRRTRRSDWDYGDEEEPFGFDEDEDQDLDGDEPISSQRNPLAKVPKKRNPRFPFLRQFADGMFKNVLSEMDISIRISQAIMDYGYNWAEAGTPGTFSVVNAYNPVIDGWIRMKDEDGPSKEKSITVSPHCFVYPEENIVEIHKNGSKRRIRRFSLSFGPDSPLGLSGPNMGAKSKTSEAALLFIAMNQAGLPIPADEATIGIFQNMHTAIPKGNQVMEGEGYFGKSLEHIAKILEEAITGDVVFIDEVPTGTQYSQEVAIKVAIVEKLLQKGVTVVMTSHAKKALSILAEKHGFTFQQFGVDEKGEATYMLSPGIATRSYAIELMNRRKTGIPDRVKHLALPYYEWIMNGGKGELPEVAQRSFDQKEKPHFPESLTFLLKKFFMQDPRESYSGRSFGPSTHFFIFPKTLDRVLGVIQRGEGGEVSNEDKESLDAIEASLPPSKDKIRDITSFSFTAAQRRGLLKQLQKVETSPLSQSILLVDAVLNTKKGISNTYSHSHTISFFEMLLADLKSFYQESSVYLGKEEALKEPFVELNLISELLTKLVHELKSEEKLSDEALHEKTAKIFSKSYHERYGAEVKAHTPPQGPKDLAAQQYDEFTSDEANQPFTGPKNKKTFHDQTVESRWNLIRDLTAEVKKALTPFDELFGTVEAIRFHNLKEPKLSKAPGPFVLKNARPLNMDPQKGLFLKDGIPQEIVIGTDRPTQVVTGPNSSGKSQANVIAFLSALMAIRGFYVPGDLEMPEYDSVAGMFGSQNVSGDDKSYFMNVLMALGSIFRGAGSNSFIVLDELQGTDNFELAAIQLAVFHCLYELGATVLSNTHTRDGLEALASKLGIDLRRTIVDINEVEGTYKARFQTEPGIAQDSLGLVLARKFLPIDVYENALKVYKELKQN